MLSRVVVLAFMLLSCSIVVTAFHVQQPPQQHTRRLGSNVIQRSPFAISQDHSCQQQQSRQPHPRRYYDDDLVTTTTSTALHVETTSSSSSDTTAVVEPPSNIIKKTITPGSGPTLKRGDVAIVSYTMYLPESGTTVSRSKQQKMVIGDGTMIAGWDVALSEMAVGERAVVRIPPNLAYGNTGVPPLIPPQATLELDITVMAATPAAATIIGLDFDGLAYADNTPRTADQISAAYEARQAKKALEPQKEGLEAWMDKVRNFYFFGFFEGETGQQAPWLLRPSITFPAIFAIVGLTFYVSYITGAISERGVPASDELDEIVLTTTMMTMMMMKQLMI